MNKAVNLADPTFGSLNIAVRPALRVDASEVSAIINELSEPLFLSPKREGAELFIASISAQAIESYICSASFEYMVATLAERIVGVIAIRGGSHLFHLFVVADLQCRGLGSRLWAEAKFRALQSGNVASFTVNSSLKALPVYEAFGFRSQGVVVEMHGVSYQPMLLAQPAA